MSIHTVEFEKVPTFCFCYQSFLEDILNVYFKGLWQERSWIQCCWWNWLAQGERGISYHDSVNYVWTLGNFDGKKASPLLITIITDCNSRDRWGSLSRQSSLLDKPLTVELWKKVDFGILLANAFNKDAINPILSRRWDPVCEWDGVAGDVAQVLKQGHTFLNEKDEEFLEMQFVKQYFLLQRGNLHLQEHQERDGHPPPCTQGQPGETVWNEIFKSTRWSPRLIFSI